MVFVAEAVGLSWALGFFGLPALLGLSRCGDGQFVGNESNGERESGVMATVHVVRRRT